MKIKLDWVLIAAFCFGLYLHLNKPGPTPPGPVTGFRVVLVYESSKSLTKEQHAVFHSAAVAIYLDAKCAEGRKGWRRWDKDIDTSKEAEVWRKLWDAAKPKLTTLPAVVITTDRSGQAFPLPATEAALLDLLKKYGGA